MTVLPKGLPACPQYINFQLVPQKNGKSDKIPCDIHGNGLKWREPENWVTAREAWASPFNRHGIGFVITDGWLVIDLDNCVEGDGWSPLAREMCDAFDGAYIDVTPSGNGLRIICRAELPDGHRCVFKGGGGEVYTEKRFVTITGEGASGDASWNAQHLVPWLVQRLGLEPEPLEDINECEKDVGALADGMSNEALIAEIKKPKGMSAKQALAMLDGKEPKVPSADLWAMNEKAFVRAWGVEGRSDRLPYDHSRVDMAVMNDLAWWTGHDVERMEQLFKLWPGFRPWKYNKRGRYHITRLLRRGNTNPGFYGQNQVATVGTAAKPGDGAETVVQGIPGEFLAYLPKNTYYHRPSGEFWPPQSVDNIIPPITVGVDDSGILPKKIKATKFIAQNHFINQISWWPGMPELIHGYVIRNGELLKREGVRVLNTYEHPSPPAGDPDNVQPWLDHIEKLYPYDAWYLVRWMAFVAQNPGVKINHGVVMGGRMRIGKDTIILPLKFAIGSQNYRTVDPEAIMKEPYNDYRQCRLLVINEAKDIGGESKFQLYEKMKPLLASPPEAIEINPKYGVRSHIPNVHNNLIMTNHLTHGLYLHPEDGRHYVAWSEAVRGKDDLDDAYFERLYAWLDKGGLENVAAYLLDVNVSDFKPKALPEKTPAFWAMVDGSKSEEHNEFAHIISLMGDKPFSMADVLIKASDEGFEELVQWLMSGKRNAIGRALAEAGANKYLNPRSKRGFWKIGGKQTYLYKLAP